VKPRGKVARSFSLGLWPECKERVYVLITDKVLDGSSDVLALEAVDESPSELEEQSAVEESEKEMKVDARAEMLTFPERSGSSE